MSDWGGTHSTSPSVNAGLDMTMPGDKTFGSGTTWFGDSLVQAVNSGQVSQNRINVRAFLPPYFHWLIPETGLGHTHPRGLQDSGFPAVNFDSWNINNPVSQHKNVQGNHKELIRQIAAASTVLLKNVDQTLPLQKPPTIGIIGNGAGPNSNGINSCEDRACTNGVLAQ
ncbi:glycoside hydrolase family 3 protein, partial [Moniliophthora roreri]